MMKMGGDNQSWRVNIRPCDRLNLALAMGMSGGVLQSDDPWWSPEPALSQLGPAPEPPSQELESAWHRAWIDLLDSTGSGSDAVRAFDSPSPRAVADVLGLSPDARAFVLDVWPKLWSWWFDYGGARSRLHAKYVGNDQTMAGISNAVRKLPVKIRSSLQLQITLLYPSTFHFIRVRPGLLISGSAWLDALPDMAPLVEMLMMAPVSRDVPPSDPDKQ